MKKILLHACCAPCASYPIQKLLQEDIAPVVFFYNPNIFPQKEYEIRRNELEKYCAKLNIEYFEGKYETEKYYKAIKGLELEKEKGKRCDKCFYLRLKETANKAHALNIDSFTTTLTISPHKDSNQIFKIAKLVEDETGVEFVPYNFKKQDGFKISRQIVKENNMYIQQYCGCEFSINKKKAD